MQAFRGSGTVLAKNYRNMMLHKKKVARIEPIKTWNIVRGDNVCVTAGKCKGQQGEVLKVFRDTNRVLIKGVNYIKKHVKKTTTDAPSGIITEEAPVHYSNVSLIDPVSGKPTRISRRFLEDGSKVRIAKKSGAVIARPDILTAPKTRNIAIGTLDTPPEVAVKLTFDESVERSQIEQVQKDVMAEMDAEEAEGNTNRALRRAELINKNYLKLTADLTDLDLRIATKLGLLQPGVTNQQQQ